MRVRKAYACIEYIFRSIYKENGGKRKMPHIHAEYSGDEVVVTLDGEILEGEIPKAKMKLLDAWMEIH